MLYRILARIFPNAAATTDAQKRLKNHEQRLDYQMEWINHLLDYQGKLLKRIEQLEDAIKMPQGLGDK